MSDKTLHPAPLSRTLFPFPKSANAGDGQAQAAEANAGEYFQALSEAEDGFFPIGYNGQWHGGIHFGAETGRHLAQDEGIRCIADGQVIAYRIDEEYPTVKYESCAPATYSRGFVLVRHRLQLPPARQTTTDTNGDRPAEEGEQPSLVFYSLYMHLRNSRAYADDPDLKRPAFWDGSIYLVGERGLDNDPFTSEPVRAGMNIRDANHRVVGFAPRGVKLKLGEPNPARRSYYRITEVVAGSTYPDDVVGMYVYKGTGTSREGLDPASEPHAKGSVYILPEPVEIKAGDIVGHLGEYQRYLDMDALAQCSTGRPLAQVDVFTHEDLPGFIEQSRLRDAELEARQKTLLHIKPGARLVQPSEPDVVLSNGEAVVVTGGDTDGRWIKGRRGTVSIVDEKPSGFSSTTRAYGDGRIFLAAVDADGNELTLEQLNALTNKNTHPRRKLLTPVGEEVWVSSGSANSQSMVTTPANVWSGFPLQVANAGGEAVAHSRVVPVGSIEQVVKEADDIRWFQVEAGTSSSGEVSGWVRESGHANVELCSPWAWPGFELFDVGELEPRELFARELANSRRTQPQEQEEFEGAARNIEESPLFDALGKAIDADGNQQVTPLELRSAMNTQWLAQAISRLVIRYPSEWSDPKKRWSRIDGLIEDEVLRKDWEHEKGRIQELMIWPHVAGQHGFPSNSTAHHFHPVGFVENFSNSCPESCKIEYFELQTTPGPFRVSKKSFDYILETERYEEFPYVPTGDTASGITIGYGYDLGHQTEANVRRDLSGLYTKAEIDDFVAVIGKTRASARTSLSNIASIFISKDDAMNLALRMKARYANDVLSIYPEVIELHPHCQGSLLSLVINRGSGLKGERRREMREIRDDFNNGTPENIAGRLRSMKRVWEGQGQGGLLKRRDKEAELFEEGLKCDCWE